MKKTYLQITLFSALATLMVSCSHQSSPSAENYQYHRDVASGKNCENVRNAEYHSYFDSVEKCLENQKD